MPQQTSEPTVVPCNLAVARLDTACSTSESACGTNNSIAVAVNSMTPCSLCRLCRAMQAGQAGCAEIAEEASGHRTGGLLAIRCSSVVEELYVWPRSPMIPSRWGKECGDTSCGVVKWCSALHALSGSPHLHQNVTAYNMSCVPEQSSPHLLALKINLCRCTCSCCAPAAALCNNNGS